MKIKVNGQMHDLSHPGPTLALTATLAKLGFTNPALATAVNGVFVPRDARKNVALVDGDQLEVLAPMQGG
ncbi:sulfur carrier protein ThiS [Aliiroseovarius lamellibrachiae]|uniref:sulfur carrier protein ThiS n=1 Tax=Aliiroseovarius lamellibrachiae TaxID=1924933 RepID=UPI001BDF8B2C|nr:sulfur carrier protein ThiS [Aliiroseovarius lamellibrachiae]MBT2131023.1 sulfur carrier protein ThiS [Aliiroseovarius lamellibrachiae]